MVIAAISWVNYYAIQLNRRDDDLNVREAELEEYAARLDDWSRDVKVREVQVTGIIRSDERLKDLRDSTPKTKVNKNGC